MSVMKPYDMKALVLSGGSGTRLRPLTYTGAKQLVPVANKPILFYVLENIAAAGIRDVGLVIAPETGQEVMEAVGNGSRWGLNAEYILQERPLGLAHAVLTAKDYLKTAPFLMYLGDNLIGCRVRCEVEQFLEDDSLSAAIFLKAVQNPRAFGVAVVNGDGQVVDLVEKPPDPPSNLALVGIYLFRPEIFEAIGNIRPSARGELEITDAISWLIKSGRKVHSHIIETWWLDTGKKDDLLLANDTVMDDWLKTYIAGSVDPQSHVTGRVHIEEGAQLIRSVVRGPVIIGAGTKLVEATIGPFTAIGPGVLIERSTVDHSVIMEGCHIRDIPRLENSVLGRRVRVCPTTTPHGAISLMVGDDCVVEIKR